MDIKIYFTPTCPHCRMAKDYIKSKNISFQEIDISQDKIALEEMVKLSGQMSVPVIVIDSEVILGFDKARIDSILG